MLSFFSFRSDRLCLDVMILKRRGLAGDEKNIAILLFLYVLQGVPLGLAAAVPLILTNRHVSYKEQVNCHRACLNI